MGIPFPTAHERVRRFRTEGDAGRHDRSSRPVRTPPRAPPRTSATVEAEVSRLRTGRELGPARIGPVLGLYASTVHRILVRHGRGSSSSRTSAGFGDQAGQDRFRTHPAAPIMLSFPGVGPGAGAGLLVEIGDDRIRFATASAAGS